MMIGSLAMITEIALTESHPCFDGDGEVMSHLLAEAMDEVELLLGGDPPGGASGEDFRNLLPGLINPGKSGGDLLHRFDDGASGDPAIMRDFEVGVLGEFHGWMDGWMDEMFSWIAIKP